MSRTRPGRAATLFVALTPFLTFGTTWASAPAAATTAATAVSAAAAPQTAETRPQAAVEADFVARINQLRAAKGLPLLQVHDELVGVARAWAREMAAVDRISHNQRLSTQVTSDWHKLGENVGVGMTVGELHDAFVASPSHYRNLVQPAYGFIGVGVVYGRNGAIFTAHQFMQLRPAAETGDTAAAPRQDDAPTPSGALASVRPSDRLVLVLEQLHALDDR